MFLSLSSMKLLNCLCTLLSALTTKQVLAYLADTKTADNNSTLLHYIVSFVSQVYHELVTFPEELTNVEICVRILSQPIF